MATRARPGWAMRRASGAEAPPAGYLAAQRWFGAADRPVKSVVVEAAEAVGPAVDWLVVAVAFADDGPGQHLQLFWDGSRDVAAHPEVAAWLFPELAEVGGVRELPGEQSNTSLVVGEEVIVKVFRRLTTERNPDAEAVRALWQAGFDGVPEPLGEAARPLHLGGRGAGGGSGVAPGDVDLAVARRFLRGARDGWHLATSDLDAFLPAAADLGRVTAEMHLALARAFGARPGDGAAWAQAMAAQLARTPGVPRAAEVADRYRALAGGHRVGAALRVHGDYHLGQALRRDGTWYVLDFEGEPARPVPERVAPTSPLKDVAGMLRSFGYAAVVGDAGPAWEAAARAAYLESYRSVEGMSDLLPEDVDGVLACFELDKAVYEVAYERSHRPSWASIPLGAVERLLGS